jgi:hypothetical protein
MPADELTELLKAFPGRICFGTDSPFSSFNLASSEAKWLRTVRNLAASVPLLGSVFTPDILS